MLTFKQFLAENTEGTKTHMMLKSSGERRYISHSAATNTHITHNRSGSEKQHHATFADAHKHLHGQGYTNTVTSHEHKKDSYVDNKMSTSKGSKKKFTAGVPGKMQDWKNNLDVGRHVKKPRFPNSDGDKTKVTHKLKGKKTKTSYQG